MAEHVVPRKVYFAVFGALIVLTLLTVTAASVDMGSMNAVVALGIASLKATLVILYFMHVRYGDRLVWVILTVGVLWLAILIVVTLSDYVSRGWLPGVGS